MHLECLFPPDICPSTTAPVTCSVITETPRLICVQAVNLPRENCCFNMTTGKPPSPTFQCPFTVHIDETSASTNSNFTLSLPVSEGNHALTVLVPGSDGLELSNSVGTINSTKGKTNFVHTLHLYFPHGRHNIKRGLNHFWRKVMVCIGMF